MKLSTLIKRLEKLKQKIEDEFEVIDPIIVVDHDGVGYYDLESVKITSLEDTVAINLQSSNEA